MDLPDVDNTEEFRCISLCSGYAGLELGIKRVISALRTVCYVEVEAFACANLVAKIEAGKLDVAPVWTDIKTFDGRPFRKRVHIITAGYPCQPFSVAGKRQGTDDPRHLWPHIERIIQAVRPVWCFFENVSGHLSLGFPEVYRSLRNLGYKVEAGLFTAAEVGVPHRRQRLFVLGKSRGTEPRRLSGCQRQENIQIRSASELADNPTGRCEDVQIQQKGKPAFRQSCGGLADTERAGPQGSGPAIQRGRGFVAGNIGYLSSTWPSRPGQPQYEWEEPRVVDNAQHRRHEPKDGQIQTGRDGTEHTDEGQTQSRLGRAATRTDSRVDRLRLLGNGVVPQQAELAFRVLISTFAKAFFEANR